MKTIRDARLNKKCTGLAPIRVRAGVAASGTGTIRRTEPKRSQTLCITHERAQLMHTCSDLRRPWACAKLSGTPKRAEPGQEREP